MSHLVFCMFDKKLKTAIQKYLDADTKNSKSGAKGAITKLINAASAMEAQVLPKRDTICLQCGWSKLYMIWKETREEYCKLTGE